MAAEAEDFDEYPLKGMKKRAFLKLLAQWKSEGVPRLGMAPPEEPASPEPQPPATAFALMDKYIAAENSIRLGKPGEAAHGLKVLMGVSGWVGRREGGELSRLI